ncbi:MAG: hypothetical protein K5673_07680, partial [Lachnospiraceae bacterium]|nr:hypothetical protein [Lachnospiraceae bacterium]
MTRYLTDVIRVDGEEFARYQDYFMEHSQDILIPYDFDDPDEAAVAYETMFAKEFPGKILGVDVDFDDFSDELKNSYAVYNHEYYLNLFERARDDFNIDNIYYAVPTGEPYVVCYMYDTNRKEKTGKDGEHYLRIEDHVKESSDTHPKLWEAWDTGEVPQGYDTI